ncbi:MAG: hypothetical protein WEG36_01485 [Gemmatimonadota bacterium]
MTASTLTTMGSLLILTLAPYPQAARGQAPDFPEIRVGQTVDAFLGTGGPTIGERGPFMVYRFEAEAGTRYSAELRSFDFDGYLIFARPAGGVTEFLKEDDDGGTDTDARLRFRIEEGGTYLLIAQAYEARTGGAFTLSLEERVLPPSQPPRPLVVGDPIEGRLTENSSVYFSDFDEEFPYDLWTFEGRGGENYVITVESADFDAYLEFGPMSGDGIQVTHTDDDGGGNLNASLRVELSHDGRFGIRARPLSEDALGAYTLTARPFTPTAAARRPILAGELVTSALTAEDALLDADIHYQEWTYAGSAGERIRISMISTEIDSYLVLGKESGDGVFEEIVFNDDGPGGTLDSEIDFTLPEDGEYLIRARSYGAGARGSYTVEVERVP